MRYYLTVGRALCAKVNQSLLGLCDGAVDATRWERLAYFHAMLDKHLDLVDRRLLKQETIPAQEKVFSLFEPHTEWIQKGKQRPNVELGHRLLIATDQQQLIQDYAVMSYNLHVIGWEWLRRERGQPLALATEGARCEI